MQLRTSLGLYNVIFHFVKKLDCIAAPLDKKLRKHQTADLLPIKKVKITALGKLKTKFMEPLVLSLSQSQGAHIVDTGTCEKQMGLSCKSIFTEQRDQSKIGLIL